MLKTVIRSQNGTSLSVSTLPAAYYVEEDVLMQEKYKLFFKYWQFVGHVDEITNPGGYKSVQIFDQNIILTRTKSGEIKAFYSVCPHRGHQLVEQDSCGSKRSFVCPYHAWSFSLDGKLQSARGNISEHALQYFHVLCLAAMSDDA